MTSSIVLRDATADDVPVLTAAIRTAFEEYRGVLTPPSGSHNESEDSVAEKLQRGGGLLAYVDEVLAGVVLYYPDGDGSLYLGRLAVLPDFRRSGVGKALVDAVEARAKQSGFPRIRVGVRVPLTANQAFFEGRGYQIEQYGTHPGYTEPTYVTLVKTI
jgi:ribosomal protein S18 acetylase RimI-like enzyme